MNKLLAQQFPLLPHPVYEIAAVHPDYRMIVQESALRDNAKHVIDIDYYKESGVICAYQLCAKLVEF